MERCAGAASSGTSEIPGHCLRGSCPFSNAGFGVLESKGGRELPTGGVPGELLSEASTADAGGWVMIMVSCVVFQLRRHGARIPGDAHPRRGRGNAGPSQPVLGRHQRDSRFSQAVGHTWHESKKINLTYASSKRMFCWGSL